MAIPFESDIELQPGATLNAATGGTVDATHVNGVEIKSTGSGTVGKIPIDQGDGTSVWADPLVQGTTAEGAAIPNPVVIGGKDGSGNNKAILADSSGNMQVNLAASSLTDPAEVAAGTTAPTKILVVGGKSNDGTPQYRALPEGAGGRSVIVEGYTGGTAVPISVTDGGDVTLGAKADAKSTATDTTPVTAMSVLKQISASVQAPPSQAVTNAGTFAVQSTLAAETTKVIGTINVASSQTIAVTSGTAANCKVAATLDAETTKVIGTVNIAASQTVKSQPAAPTAATYTSAVINFSGSGDNTIVAGVGGQTVRIYKIQFTVAGATNVKFGDTTVTYTSGAYVLTGNGSSFSDWMNGEPLFVTATGKGFLINSSVAVSVQGIVYYTVS